MEKRSILIGWVRRLGLIHGFTMMLVYVIFLVARPDATLEVSFLGKMILFSLVSSLPGLIYLSRHELSEREWWIRTIIHYILLNVLLLPVSHLLDVWHDTREVLLFMALILIVDVLVHVLSFSFDWIAARDINKKLLSRQTKQ